MTVESLATALEQEHREIDDALAAFSASPDDRGPVTRAIRALRRHIYLEEEILFPLLRDAEPALTAPVFVMLREHAQIWGTLDTLEHDLAVDGAAAAALIRRLTVQLLHHNRKEEKILYPRADDVLPPAAAARLRSLLDTGTPLDGWVCTKARP